MPVRAVKVAVNMTAMRTTTTAAIVEKSAALGVHEPVRERKTRGKCGQEWLAHKGRVFKPRSACIELNSRQESRTIPFLFLLSHVEESHVQRRVIWP